MVEKRALIFCSANYDIDEKYNQAARDLVRTLCARGYSVVSGGTVKGTMGVVSDTVVSCGGCHRGVIPRFMQSLVYPNLTETVFTDTMSERKEKMREGTSLAIALPGGIGTMDELMETLTLAKLGLYGGRILAYDVEGFFGPLKDFLDYLVKTNMLYQRDRDLISFPSTLEEVERCL